MATSLKLRSDIKKYEAAIKSKATPAKFKDKLKVQLGKAKSQLESMKSSKAKKPSAPKKKSALDKLKARYKGSGVDIKKDSERPALPLGRRTSKSGNTYYENRLNRADVRQPPKRYPKLEDGGYMEKGGDATEQFKYGIFTVSENAQELGHTFYSNNPDLEFDPYGDDVPVSVGSNQIVKRLEYGGMMKYGGQTKILGESGATYKLEMWDSFEDMMANKNPTKVVYSEIESKLKSDAENHQEINGASKLYKKRKGKYLNISTFLEDGGYMAKGGETFELYDINGEKIEEGDVVKSTQPSGGILSPSEGQIGVVEKTKDAFGQDDFQIRFRKEGKNFDQFILLNHKINEIISKGNKMAYGGKTKSRKGIRYLTVEEISSLTGMSKVGVDKFADDYNLTDTDLSNIMQGIGRGQISKLDFSTAVLGNKDNSYAKEIVNYAKSGKGYKMADGGMMAKGGKLDIAKIREEYEENEDNNAHSENVVLLAKHFGSEQDLRDAKTILAKHEAIGSLPSYLMKERDDLSIKLFKKMVEASQGKMADGGEIVRNASMEGFSVGDRVKYKARNSKYMATILKIVDDKDLPYAAIKFDNKNKVEVAYLDDLVKLQLMVADEYINPNYMADGGELHRTQE